jgi:ubiquinone/menaquinone biosynthesis C-methylase UbiE
MTVTPLGDAVSNLQQGFQGVGEPAAAVSLVSWLEHADALPAVQEIKRQMLALGPVEAGDRVLDVGCGIGLEVRRLAGHAGPIGRVVGIDKNAAMIAEAAFDLCRTERVLRYIKRPEHAVREMARVVRPGGRVVAFDFDSDATVIDAPDAALVRRIREVLDAAVPNCWIGRQLPRLFRQAGLVDIAVVPQAVMIPSLDSYRRLVQGSLDAAARSGDLTVRDLARWWADLARAEREGGLLVANLGFVVHGRRPSDRCRRWAG